MKIKLVCFFFIQIFNEKYSTTSCTNLKSYCMGFEHLTSDLPSVERQYLTFIAQSALMLTELVPFKSPRSISRL